MEFLILKPNKSLPADRYYPIRRRIANTDGLVVYAHPRVIARMNRALAQTRRTEWLGAALAA